MIKSQVRIVIKLKFLNEFLVAGGIGEKEHHVGIVKDLNGYPYIPASAFKGKLRYYYNLVTPFIFKGIEDESISELEKILFGGVTNDRGILKFTDFRIKAELENNKFVDTTLKRTSVAINRLTKTNMDGSLFTTETSAIAGTSELNGELSCYCTDEELKIFAPVLFACFRMMYTFGGRKSTGLGWLEKEPEVEFKINSTTIAKESIFDWSNIWEDNLKEYIGKINVHIGSNIYTPLEKIPSDYKYIYKVSLKQKLDLLIGGKKLNNNFLISQKEISGSVLKAGLAKFIDEQCPYKNRVNGKKHWVHFVNKELCKKCYLKSMCSQFDTIHTATLRSFGARVLPLTAYRCKYYNPYGECDKKLYDSVVHLIKYKTNIDKNNDEKNYNSCDCGAKAERLRGFYKDNRMYTPLTNFVTKSSIYPKTLSSKAGNLYSVLGLNGRVSIENLNDGTVDERENVFEGYIKTEKPLDLSKFDIFIGRSNNAGFGSCEIELVKEEYQDVPVLKRLTEFNQLTKNKNSKYYTVTLLTNLILNIKENNKPLEKIFDNFVGKLLFAIKEEEMVRGFDTSSSNNKGYLREKRGVIKAGSVFVFEVSKNTDLQTLSKTLKDLEKKGIGEDTILGFGAIRICDEFHIKERLK